MDIAREVFVSHTAQQALTFVAQYCVNEHVPTKDCPDLILLDISMPIMDGFEFVEALQAMNQHHLIQQSVVALTSSSYPKDREKMLSLGVGVFLTKPVTEEKIMGLAAGKQ